MKAFEGSPGSEENSDSYDLMCLYHLVAFGCFSIVGGVEMALNVTTSA